MARVVVEAVQQVITWQVTAGHSPTFAGRREREVLAPAGGQNVVQRLGDQHSVGVVPLDIEEHPPGIAGLRLAAAEPVHLHGGLVTVDEELEAHVVTVPLAVELLHSLVEREAACPDAIG